MFKMYVLHKNEMYGECAVGRNKEEAVDAINAYYDGDFCTADELEEMEIVFDDGATWEDYQKNWLAPFYFGIETNKVIERVPHDGLKESDPKFYYEEIIIPEMKEEIDYLNDCIEEWKEETDELRKERDELRKQLPPSYEDKEDDRDQILHQLIFEK